MCTIMLTGNIVRVYPNPITDEGEILHQGSFSFITPAGRKKIIECLAAIKRKAKAQQ